MRYVLLTILVGLVVGYSVYTCTQDRYNEVTRAFADSLGQSRSREQMYRDSARINVQRGIQAQEAKPLVVIQYLKDTTRNHRLSLHTKDSLIKIGLPPGDSSRITDPLANKVLDMGSRITMLYDEAKLDSITIGDLMIGYYQLDTANQECHRQVELVTLSAQQDRKESKRRVRLWQVATALAIILACL